MLSAQMLKFLLQQPAVSVSPWTRNRVWPVLDVCQRKPIQQSGISNL